MPNLTVPDEYASGLSRIVNLSIEDSRKIAKALEQAKTTNLRELTELVVSAVPGVSVREAREMVAALRSLYSARTSLEVTVDAFVNEVLKAARQNVTPQNPPVDMSSQADSLRNLLSVRPLSMVSKARGLHIDHENIFCSARIISDIRPIFDVDITQEPTGFVMAHILKLGYHHSGKHTELYVALDKLDLQTMIDALQRAQTKAASIKNFSRSKDLSILAE